jgi:hypothetical protein
LVEKDSLVEEASPVEASDIADSVTARELYPPPCPLPPCALPVLPVPPPPCPFPPIPKVKTTTTTTTTTTATTTVTVGKPFPPPLPPPKVCTTCCTGGCPWARQPRLQARGLPESAPTSYQSSVPTASSRRSEMYSARASSIAGYQSDYSAVPSPTRSRRTTTVYSTTWTRTTVTTTATRTPASRTVTRAAATSKTAPLRKVSMSTQSLTSGAGVVGTSIRLSAILGIACLAVLA